MGSKAQRWCSCQDRERLRLVVVSVLRHLGLFGGRWFIRQSHVFYFLPPCIRLCFASLHCASLLKSTMLSIPDGRRRAQIMAIEMEPDQLERWGKAQPVRIATAAPCHSGVVTRLTAATPATKNRFLHRQECRSATVYSWQMRQWPS